jgi:FixJ family two-component response regulator
MDKAGVAPIFILADDDREAIERIIRMLNPDWYYIPVLEARLIVRYARQFAVTAVFLADAIENPPAGTATLVQELRDQVGKPVVVLAESWDAARAERWKELGAEDCLPHPTRTRERMETLRAKMRELALADAG